MEAPIQVIQAAVTPLHHPLGINKEIDQSQDNVVLTVYYTTRQCNIVVFTVHLTRQLHKAGYSTPYYVLPTLLAYRQCSVVCGQQAAHSLQCMHRSPTHLADAKSTGVITYTVLVISV